MLKNIGALEQTVRIIAGVSILTAADFLHGGWCWIALPGATLALTGIIARCPLYLSLDLRTKRA